MEMGTAEANHGVGFANLKSGTLVGVRYENEIILTKSYFLLLSTYPEVVLIALKSHEA